MRIGLVRRVLDPNGGGAEKVACALLQELLRRGHQVTVFSEVLTGIKADGVNCRWIQVPQHGLASSSTLRFQRHVGPLLQNQRQNLDVILTLCRALPADVFMVTEQVHVEWCQGRYLFGGRLNPRHRGIMALERQCFKHIPLILVNSQLVRAQVLRRFALPAERVLPLPLGIDSNRFTPPVNEQERQQFREQLQLSPDKIVLLFVAMDFATKRLDIAMRGLAALPPEYRHNFQLLAVGGEKVTQFARLAESLDIAVHFAGRQNELRRFYCASDLFYYPGPYETFGMVCLEAAACALPVLISEAKGASEIVIPGKNGYLVKGEGEPQELSAMLRQFADLTASAREQMRLAALASTEKYNMQHYFNQLEKHLQAVAADRTQNTTV